MVHRTTSPAWPNKNNTSYLKDILLPPLLLSSNATVSAFGYRQDKPLVILQVTTHWHNTREGGGSYSVLLAPVDLPCTSNLKRNPSKTQHPLVLKSYRSCSLSTWSWTKFQKGSQHFSSFNTISVKRKGASRLPMHQRKLKLQKKFKNLPKSLYSYLVNKDITELTWNPTRKNIYVL
jgi:hypothetical protein